MIESQDKVPEYQYTPAGKDDLLFCEDKIDDLRDGEHTYETLSRKDNEFQVKSVFRSWRPFTLRPVVLGSYIVTSVCFIALLEFLSHYSTANDNANGGGIIFAETVNDISPAAKFSFLYLPTVLAVCYSTFWSWVDLDVKRLEPWFQMSKHDGASAQNSLLLQYPFEFLALVPLNAARRRHWAVFNAGTVMMIIFWIITPFQSAIFTTGAVVRTGSIDMTVVGTILLPESQLHALTTNFLNTAYGISWLNQKLPEYSTRSYAILPFVPEDGHSTNGPDETWTTLSTAYSTNLTCTPARMALQVDRQYSFDNGRGCNVTDISIPSSKNQGTNYTVMYIGYHDSPTNDYSLQNPRCSSESSQNFLAIWGSAASEKSSEEFSGVYANMTAVFCMPTYSEQTVLITINASDHAILASNYTDFENATVAGTPSDFNTTNFEYIAGAGVTESTQQQNYPDTVRLEQFPRLINYSVSWPVSTMVGFAIAENDASVEDLSDPIMLQRAFTKAHRLLYSMAISTLTTPRKVGLATQPGSWQAPMAAIIFVRPFSIAVEISLGLVAIMAGVLWVIMAKRRNLLTQDVASIADVMAAIEKSPELLTNCLDAQSESSSALNERISQNRYRLLNDEFDEKPVMRLEENLIRDAEPLLNICPNKKIELNERKENAQPLELSAIMGSALILLLGAAFCAVIVLYYIILRQNGIRRPTGNAVVLTILENLLPTAFASVIEPIWVLLNRLLCLLRPFDELRKGNAKSATSLEVKYTSLPPQLVIWRAVKARHFLLAFICFVSISSNILAVALSGLFNEFPITVTEPMESVNQLAPLFNDSAFADFGRAVETSGAVTLSYLDHFYIKLSNLSSGTSLPTWVDEKYFYLPFELNSNTLPAQISGSTPQIQAYRGQTRGFGVSLKCHELLSPGTNNSVYFSSDSNGSTLNLQTEHTFPALPSYKCYPHLPLSGIPNSEISSINYPDSASALELTQTMRNLDSAASDLFCQTVVVAGWVRLAASATAQPSASLSDNGTNGRKLSHNFIGCYPSLQIAEFEVTVDPDGHVLQSTQTGPFSPQSDLADFLLNTSNSTSTLLQRASALIAPDDAQDGLWHNNSLTNDWPNSLLQLMLNTTSLTDPLSPPPDASLIIPEFEKLYSSLFAILLSLNQQIFVSATDEAHRTAIIGSILTTETRIFMSLPLFYTSAALLALHLFAAMLYYGFRPPTFLPRLPTSIASVISFVAGSRCLADFGAAEERERSRGWEGGRPAAGNKKKMRRYAYGRFIGTDGKTRVGIEREPWVVPLESRNPEARRRRWWMRGDESVPKSWI